jgi:hypothetical protein
MRMSTPMTGQGSSVAEQHRAVPAADEPTIGRLVADTSRHLSSLIRAEIALAKSELKISVTAGGVGLALLAVAGLLAALAVILGSFAAAYFLAKIPHLDVAWGLLIMFGLYLLIGGVLVLLALRRFKKVKAPERTIETTKETMATLRHR